MLLYLAKLGVLLVLLAWWELARGKVRLRAVVAPLLLATGVLLFAVVLRVVSYIQQAA